MTLRESSIAVLGLCASVLLYVITQSLWYHYLLFIYAWGLSFESLTQNLWKYAPDVGHTKRCIPGTDINIVFPLGWAFVLSFSAWLIQLYPLFSNKWLNYVFYTGIVGSCMEICYYNLKFWKYEYQQKIMHMFRPYLPKLTVLGVPVQIIIGYFLVIGSMNYFIFCKLFNE